MPNAKIVAVLAIVTAAMGACSKSQDKQAPDQTMAIDEGVAENQVAGNADIETLPADESSTTPSNQLQNGFDSPDVNEVATSNS